MDRFELDLIGFKSLSTSKLDLFQSETKHTIKDYEVISGVEFAEKSDGFLVMAWWYIIKRDLLYCWLDSNIGTRINVYLFLNNELV